MYRSLILAGTVAFTIGFVGPAFTESSQALAAQSGYYGYSQHDYGRAAIRAEPKKVERILLNKGLTDPELVSSQGNVYIFNAWNRSGYRVRVVANAFTAQIISQTVIPGYRAPARYMLSIQDIQRSVERYGYIWDKVTNVRSEQEIIVRVYDRSGRELSLVVSRNNGRILEIRPGTSQYTGVRRISW